MNQIHTKITGAMFFAVLALPSLAQNWQVGGNTNPQLGGNPPVMGTIGNNPLQFITNNTQDFNPYAVFSCCSSPTKTPTLAN